MNVSTLIVVPCLNENRRLRGFLPELCQEMDAVGDAKILVIDDGSLPGEQQQLATMVGALQKEHACLLPVKLLPDNIGKGGAVYAGWCGQENFSWLGFIDADGSCPAREAARMIRYARNMDQPLPRKALFASRVKMLGRNVRRHWKRHFLGRIYATMVSELLNIPVYDSQCGLKLVPSASYQQSASSLKIRRFAFDVDLMVALLDSGCEIEEFPIDWHETEGGKVNLLVDPFVMLKDIFFIRHQRCEKHKLHPTGKSQPFDIT